MPIEDLMNYMLNLFNNTAKELSEEYEKLSQKDMELSDLDHYIESRNLKAPQLAKVGRLRKTLREERRQIKNNINLLTEKDIQVMIRDIEETYSYGDKCDEAEWKALLKILKERREMSGK